ncbi:MAG TPA: lipopolysaccharide heptosyltransferase II [Syntrophales bacterium]|nr:lipopolysaccharide heptosyltransferase II [Syntrophales bacterium]
MKISIRTSRRIEDAQNILVRGTNWIGDVIMTLPAMAAIRRSFPQAKISALVKPWVADIFSLCSDVDEVIIYSSPGIHEGFQGLFRLAGELREKKYDAAILLQNAIEAAIITCLAGIPIRAGYNSDGRGPLLTHSVKRTRAVRQIHQVNYYLEMVKTLGCQNGNRDFHLTLSGDDENRAFEILQQYGIDRRDFLVGIAPGATYGAAKKWFPDRFAAVADRLGDDYAAKILLFGSAADRESTQALSGYARHTLADLAGRTTLREAISLISRCRLFISNDSGLMHVAGALGIPTLAIFGSTNPVTTSPPGEKSVIVHKDLPCSPCLKTTCPTDFQCMDLIGVDDVYGVARWMIQN